MIDTYIDACVHIVTRHAHRKVYCYVYMNIFSCLRTCTVSFMTGKTVEVNHYFSQKAYAKILIMAATEVQAAHCRSDARPASEERHVHPPSTHGPPAPNTTCNIDSRNQHLTDICEPACVLKNRQVCIIYCGLRKARPHCESVNNR